MKTELAAERAARRDSRRRTVLVTVSMLVTVAVVGLVWATWASGQRTAASSVTSARPSAASTPAPESPSAAPTAATASAPPSAPAAPGTLPPAEASAQVADFLAAAAAIAPDATDTADQLSTVASGAIVSEIENDQQELVANGWTQKGTPVVVSLRIVSTDATASPPTTVAEACIDSSAVVIFDSDGKPLAGAGNDDTHRALTLFTLEQNGASWRVTARTFPNDPLC